MRDRFAAFARAIAATMILMAASLALLAAPAQAQQNRLNGTYMGLDAAHGITIRIAPGGRGYQGEITAQSGGTARIDAQDANGAAEGPLSLRGREGIVRLIPKPLGLSMMWMPLGPGGAPVDSEAVLYAFRHQGVSLPTLPPGYVEPPHAGAERVDPIGFLHSYEFWEPNAAALAYDKIDDKYRVIMRTFPVVHGDILWKLCKATVPTRQLGEALRGQGMTCTQLDARLKASQSTGGFTRFKQRLATERADALLAVECARGIHTAQICADAAQRTQRAATSMDTLASILQGL